MLIDAYWCLLVIVSSSVSQTWMWVQSLSKRGKNMAFQRVGNMTLKMRRSCQWSQSCFWVEKFCTSGAEGTSKIFENCPNLSGVPNVLFLFLCFRNCPRPLSDAEPVTPAEPVARWGPGGPGCTLSQDVSRCLKMSQDVSSCSVYVGCALSALFARLH